MKSARMALVLFEIQFTVKCFVCKAFLLRIFGYNARGMDISHNFPTVHYIRSRMGEEPASENETKALIRIIQEYDGRGLLTFAQSGREIIYYHCQQGVGSLPKSYRLARHMQKSSSYHLEREQMTESAREKFKGMGTPEQYYIQTKKQPAFRIKVPAQRRKMEEALKEDKKAVYEEIHLLPLEYIFSIRTIKCYCLQVSFCKIITGESWPVTIKGDVRNNRNIHPFSI